MKLRYFFFAALFFIPVFLYSQELILESYQRNFIKAGLSGKARVLNDAANDDSANEFIGQLYSLALNYVSEYGGLLRDDPDMIELVVTAARGIGETRQAEAAPVLWDLLVMFRDSYSRVEIINALGAVGRGNRIVTENLNNFVLEINRDFLLSRTADYPVLQAATAAMVLLGDSSSYTAMFATAVNFPPPYSLESFRAMDAIPGYLKMFLADQIRIGSTKEKLTAFIIAADSKSLSDEDKGDLAETALEAALSLPSQDDNSTALRYDAIVTISDLKRTRASPLAIKHFNMVNTAYKSGRAPRERLLEAINCLKNMGDFESAQTLVLELGRINAEVENGSIYDEGLVLALVRAIGEMGDKVAFDYLLYISYLRYSDQIKAAAREALVLLRW